MKKKEDSIWKIIKYSIKEVLKAETSTQGGKINFLFGVFIFIVILGCMTTSVAQIVGKCINPKIEVGMPWYGNLSAFMLAVVYFVVCVKNVIGIEKLKQPIQEQINK